MNLKRKRKFYKGDFVKYRTNTNEVLEGEIIEAPKEYACDGDMSNIGDFYIISQGRIEQGHVGTCYVVNSRNIYEFEEEI